MLVALYVILGIAGYILMGMLVDRLVSNQMIMRKFKPALARITKDNYKEISYTFSKITTEAEKKLEAYERAYNTARTQSEADREMGATLAGVFWPVGIFYLLGLHAVDGLSGLTKTTKPLPSKAERQIAKLEQQIESDKMRREHINGLIKDAKSMGMSDDVIKGFEEMKKNI